MDNRLSDTGRMTLPAQEGMEKEVAMLIKRWGVDAVRDSDGTKLSEDIKKIAKKVYSKCFLTRGDNEWASEHRDQLQQLYLMSEPKTAYSDVIEINLLEKYYNKQFELDTINDPKQFFEVINRTTGEVVSNEKWTLNYDTNIVTITAAKPFNVYTVNFLVFEIWDPVHMYNAIVNNWDIAPHLPYDPRHKESREHLLKHFEQWIIEHNDSDVIRLTTFFYNFTLVFNEKAKEKYVDWFGYGASVSAKALIEFEKKYGYKLTSEDFVDEGYYNTSFRNPSKAFIDWMDFQQKFVSELGAQCVKLIHKYNKEAMMFLGDQWIGTEPYGNYFKNIGLDAVVGSVGNGTTLRMISDIPNVKYTEGRFLPYFFPDTFHEGGDPVKELEDIWVKSRRAILRSPIDRMGFGGYLSLAVKFPDFVTRVEDISNEFRNIHKFSKGEKPYTTIKVGILNSWGKIRSWMTNQVAHALWHKKIYSYVGVIEALSGMAVDVEFISFSDIKESGIAKDLHVIINAGEAGTAWSGGDNWLDETVVTTIREWVYNGGGFIGVGEPTACQHQGQLFQLADVLGVQKDIGFNLSLDKYDKLTSSHFILEGVDSDVDYGEGMKSVYGVSDRVKTLSMDEGDVNLSVNEYGKGRSVYIAGLPYNATNCRVLLRAIHWASNKEVDMKKGYTTNINTECAIYKEQGYCVVINNSITTQETLVYLDDKETVKVMLERYEMKWIKI